MANSYCLRYSVNYPYSSDHRPHHIGSLIWSSIASMAMSSSPLMGAASGEAVQLFCVSWVGCGSTKAGGVSVMRSMGGVIDMCIARHGVVL